MRVDVFVTHRSKYDMNNISVYKYNNVKVKYFLIFFALRERKR